MADSRISDYAALTGANLATGDLYELVDVSDTSMAATGTNKKMTASELELGLKRLGLLDSQDSATVGNPASFDQQFAIGTLAIPTTTPAGAVLGYSFAFLGITATATATVELFLGSAVTTGTIAGYYTAVVGLRTFIESGLVIVRGTSDVVVQSESLKMFQDGEMMRTVEVNTAGAVVTTEDLTAGRSLFLRGKVGSASANDWQCTRHYSRLWRVA